jgi:hypothetical protein
MAQTKRIQHHPAHSWTASRLLFKVLISILGAAVMVQLARIIGLRHCTSSTNRMRTSNGHLVSSCGIEAIEQIDLT